MSLPEFFKLVIVNNTGAQIDFSTDGANNTFVVTGQGYKFDSNGALEYGSEVTIFADPAADLADGAAAEGAEFDNSSDKFIGMLLRASLETDNNSAGRIDIFWEWSTDGSAGGSYPSDEDDFDPELDLDLIKSLIVAATADQHRGTNLRLE